DRLGDVTQRGVGSFAEQRLAGDPGVDRDHPVAFALQIFHHKVARPVPVRRGANHRNGLDPLQNHAELRVGIGDRIEAAHGSLTGALALLILNLWFVSSVLSVLRETNRWLTLLSRVEWDRMQGPKSSE